MKPILVLLLCSRIAFCKNSEQTPKTLLLAMDSIPTVKTAIHSLPPSFYQHWIGQLGNRPAALEVVRHGRYTHGDFYAHFYFLDTIHPLFLEGWINKNALKSDYKVVNGRAVLRSERVERPVFEARWDNYPKTACGSVNLLTLQGSFTSTDSIKGIGERCDGVQIPFQFGVSQQSESLSFQTISYTNQYKLTANTTEAFNGFLTVEALLPDSLQQGSLLVSRAIEAMMLPSLRQPHQSFQEHLHQYGVQFFEQDKPFLEQQPNQLAYRDYLLSVSYNQKNLLSLLLIQKWDVVRNHGCHAMASNYDLKANRRIDFETIFLDHAQRSLLHQIKSKYSHLEKVDDHIAALDWNNFILTHQIITFLSFTEMDSHNGLLMGTPFFFPLDELKSFIRPAFLESLKD